MASIDMCEHDWPGTGCRECFPKKPKFNEYSIPMDFENLPPVMVLEHNGKFYSFGRTCRTSQSVWDEVKDTLEFLKETSLTDEDIADLAQYKVN